MRKIISTILLMTMATSFSACAKTTEPSSTEPVKQQLTNHMTAKEKQEAKETDFQLLDHPWEQYMNTGTDNEYESYKDKVYLIPKIGAIVYGDPVFCIPPENYDGGKGTVSYMNYSDGSGEVTVTQIDFKNYEEFKDIIDLNYGGALGLAKFKEEGGIVTVYTDAFFDVLYAKDSKIRFKRETFRAVFQRRTDIPINLEFSMTKIQCPACAGSFNAMRNKKCPYCGNAYDIISDDWVLVDLKYE